MHRYTVHYKYYIRKSQRVRGQHKLIDCYMQCKKMFTISKSPEEMLSYLATKLLHIILERPFVVNSEGEDGTVARFNIKPFVQTYELPSISRGWRTPSKLTLKFSTSGRKQVL